MRGIVRFEIAAHRSKAGADPEEHFRAAAADLDRAIELEPTFGRLWRSRAYVARDWIVCRLNARLDPVDLFEPGIQAATRAWELSPSLVDALVDRGAIRYLRGFHRSRRGGDSTEDWAAAEADFSAALREDARNPSAWWRRGVLRGARSRWNEAVADLEEAHRLNPGSPLIRGELAKARARAGAGSPPAWLEAFDRAAAAAASGDYRTAGREYEAGLAALDGELSALAAEERERRFNDPVVRGERSRAHYNLACILSQASIGKDRPDAPPRPVGAEEAARARDRAFENLERWPALDPPPTTAPKKDPDLVPLHDDPRWASWLSRLRRDAR